MRRLLFLHERHIELLAPGTIRVIDHDSVDISNLHRQILHTTDRVGMNKAQSAVLALKALVYPCRYDLQLT